MSTIDGSGQSALSANLADRLVVELVNAADPVQAWPNTPRDRRLVIDGCTRSRSCPTADAKDRGVDPATVRIDANTSLAHLPPGVPLMWVRAPSAFVDA
jgi:hypothetical protein